MLETLRRWLGGEDLSEYERHTLTEEYRRLTAKIASIDERLDTVHCSSCPTSQHPEARRLIARKREHEDRLSEIEDRLGQVPDVKQTASRRASKRER